MGGWRQGPEVYSFKDIVGSLTSSYQSIYDEALVITGEDLDDLTRIFGLTRKSAAVSTIAWNPESDESLRRRFMELTRKI